MFGSKLEIQTPEQIGMMRRAGIVVGETLELLRGAVEPGITTGELDAIAEDAIRSRGGAPNFMLEPGYRHTICANVNEHVVHGIPTDRPLEAGDIGYS